MDRKPEHGRARGSPIGGIGARWHISDLFLLALAAGLLFGLGEVGAVAWRRFVRDAVTHITPHVAWMAPTAYAAIFLTLGLALAAARRTHNSLRGPGAAVVTFGTLGLVGWLEMTPWAFHPAAVWALALGVSSQLARLATHRPQAMARWTRRAVPVLVAVTATLGAGVVLAERTAERRALASLGPAPQDAPNVLLLILDTVRAKSLSLYGYERSTTPGLEAVAADATVFDAAFATAPWTLPSHASMFTGRWPHEVSTGWSTPLDEAEATLAEVLSRRGYATAGFVANLAYLARPYGLARGFAHYEDFPISLGQLVLTTSLGRTVTTSEWLRELIGEHELLNRKTAGRIRRDFVRWVDRRPPGPFFAFLNFFDAHEPYLPPRPYDRAFGPPIERRGIEHRQNLLRGVNARRSEKWTTRPEDIPGELAAYEGAIAYLDAELSGLFEDLRDRGLLDGTLLIVASDHGELFGEHGMYDHGNNLYMPALHVPLLFRLPGRVPAGVRVHRPVSIRDIPATIVDLIGLSVEEPFPGVSLSRAWEGEDGRSVAPQTASPRPLKALELVAAAQVGGVPPTDGAHRVARPRPWATRAGVTTSPPLAVLHRGLVEQPWYPIARGLEMQSLVDQGFHYICNPDATEELYDLASDLEERSNLAPSAPGLITSFRAVAASLGAPPRWCPPAPGERSRAP